MFFGGGRIDRSGFYLEPTVLAGITEENLIHAQEYLVRLPLSASSRMKMKPSAWQTQPHSVLAPRYLRLTSSVAT